MRTLSSVLVAGALTALAADAQARSFRLNQIPNAPDGCGTCHVSVGGGGPRNVFGQQVETNLTQPGSSGNVQWAVIFNLDADSDGCTNGAELGDPNGNWRTGSPRPMVSVSAPHLPADNVCANMMDMGPVTDMGAVDMGSGEPDAGAMDMMAPDMGAMDMMDPDMGAMDMMDPDMSAMDMMDPDMGVMDMMATDTGPALDMGGIRDAGGSTDSGVGGDDPDDEDDGGCTSVPASSAGLWLLAALAPLLTRVRRRAPLFRRAQVGR